MENPKIPPQIVYEFDQVVTRQELDDLYDGIELVYYHIPVDDLLQRNYFAGMLDILAGLSEFLAQRKCNPPTFPTSGNF